MASGWHGRGVLSAPRELGFRVRRGFGAAFATMGARLAFAVR
jgi:hypothetical protein